MTPDDEAHLRRAIALAQLGRGTAEPNPLVGCVLVNHGRVIGEGYHARYGGPHAEPAALDACTENPAGATAYVTLEPCCHTAKQTPPCAPRLVAAGVARVVVGCLDPNPAVNGRGVALLRSAGVTVDGPRLEPACKQLIAPFLARVANGRPYVTLKWAESADGKVAGPGGRRVRISNARSSLLVQHLRAKCDAILVGVGTALADDPRLLPRGVPTVRPTYRRVVLDTDLRLPPDGKIARSVDRGPVVVFTTVAPDDARRRPLIDRGVEIVTVEDDRGRPSFPAVLHHLSAAGVTHLLVEPGPTLAAALLRSADRLWVIRSPRRIDDPTAPAAAGVPAEYVRTATVGLDGDQTTEWLNAAGDVYFSPEPSADWPRSSPGP